VPNEIEQKRDEAISPVFSLVGPSGFEPPTSCTPSKRHRLS
jgi:hypothetical protein